MPHPLTFSDQQLSLIFDAAAQIPSQWRTRFLEACADRLLCLDVVKDADVTEAARYVSTRMGVNIEQP